MVMASRVSSAPPAGRADGVTGHGLISDPVKFQKWGRIGLIARIKLFVKRAIYG